MRQDEAGKVQELAPGLRGLIAPNPGPMTHWGTNTFIVGEGSVAVVDPGPSSAAHLEAILSAVQGEQVSHILVTHAHLDHSPLATELKARTGAPVLAFGGPEDGRSATMAQLARDGLAGGGEGVDLSFRPDTALSDGETVDGEGWMLEVLHTPGHFASHVAFRFGDALLSGDHVMDWSSSLVSPPDGDLRSFMETSRRLRDLDGLTFFPSHGGALHDPAGRLGWLIAHREAREVSILNALSRQPQGIAAIAQAVYHDVPAAMRPAAERNVFAHLIDLVERNLVVATPELSQTASYRRV
jgi:glyoxylase-like metal-dependent hydrolase (beta-lactamase superfamily II)